MAQEAEIKKELFEDREDLRQQLADMEMSRSEAQDFLPKLQASEIRYRRLFETAQDGILILDAETGQIDDVNPYMIDMLHYSYEEFMGKKLWEVSPFKDTVLNRAAFEELQGKGYIRYKDLPLETKEGEPIAVEFVSNVYKANGNKVIQCNIRNITSRKQAMKLLLEANNKYRELAESISDVFFAMDNNLRYTYWNKASEKLTGIPAETALGKSLLEIFPDNDARKQVEDMYLLTIESKKPQHLIVNYPSDELVVHEISSYPTIEGVSVFVKDVTDRKKAEESLRESESMYRTLINNIPQKIFTKDRNSVYMSSNENYAFDLDTTPEGIKGKTDYIYFPKELADKYRADDKRIIESETVETIEEQYVKGAEVFWVQTTKTPLRDAQGNTIGVLGIFSDITERKQGEEERKLSEARLAEAQSVAKIGSWETDLSTLIVIWSKETYRIFEIDPDSFQPSHPVFMAFVHPEDRVKVDAAFINSINKHEPSTIEHRIVTPGGFVKFMEERWQIFHDAQGLPVRAVGTCQDITDRKKVEKILQDTLLRLRKAVGTTIQVMVSTIEARDPYTAGHQIRSADLARTIAIEMGLPQEKIDGIRMVGTIHDIGKISIPAEILSKPTKLSEIEFALIKEHAHKGFEMLKDVESSWPLAEIVYQHHERMDGSGYPRNLKGEEICMEARILSVADVVEAMASHRPYRPGLGIDAALNEIEKNRGILYDNTVADACLRLFREKGFKLEGT